jgi:hypothetical protein
MRLKLLAVAATAAVIASLGLAAAPAASASSSVRYNWQTTTTSFSYTGTPGTGPSLLSVVQSQYPNAQLTSAQQAKLAAIHSGARFHLAGVSAADPSGCGPGGITPCLDFKISCADPFNCVYYDQELTGNAQAFGTDLEEVGYTDYWADNGDSVNFNWHFGDLFDNTTTDSGSATFSHDVTYQTSDPHLGPLFPRVKPSASSTKIGGVCATSGLLYYCPKQGQGPASGVTGVYQSSESMSMFLPDVNGIIPPSVSLFTRFVSNYCVDANFAYPDGSPANTYTIAYTIWGTDFVVPLSTNDIVHVDRSSIQSDCSLLQRG